MMMICRFEGASTLDTRGEKYRADPWINGRIMMHCKEFRDRIRRDPLCIANPYLESRLLYSGHRTLNINSSSFHGLFGGFGWLNSCHHLLLRDQMINAL